MTYILPTQKDAASNLGRYNYQRPQLVEALQEDRPMAFLRLNLSTMQGIIEPTKSTIFLIERRY